MKNHVLAIGVIVAALVALGITAYAYTGMRHSDATLVQHPGHEPWMRHWHPMPHGCRHPWGPAVGHHAHKAPRLVVSDAFREKVLGILESDNRTAALLSEGFNVTAIKPIVQGIVKGDGSVELKAVKAVVFMKKNGGGARAAAVAVVDIDQGAVLKLVVHETAVYTGHS